MGQQAAQRELRRETKRTLGNHLKDFASNHLARLEALEKRVDHQRKYIDEQDIAVRTVGNQNNDILTSYVATFTAMSLTQRLRWFFLGQLPEWPK